MHRRFERTRDGVTEYREIRQEGIRCQVSWGRVGGRGSGMRLVRDDEADAQRRVRRKAAEWQRKGFTEVPAEGADPAEACPAAEEAPLVLGTTANARLTPVPGFPEVYGEEGFGPAEYAHHRYRALRPGGRSAVGANVRSRSYDAEAVRAFLEWMSAHRELPFDGATHHKAELPEPIGPFTHVLVCGPQLSAMDGPGVRTAMAAPVRDCEIADADTEVLVDARIRGRGALAWTDWSREPHPVTDLRFELPGARETKKFKVYRPAGLVRGLERLAAAPDPSAAWLEVRNFRGAVRRLTPEHVPDRRELTPFLLGEEG